MLYRRLASLFICCLVTTSLFAQGLETRATKDDWEEINFEFNSSILSDGYPSLLRLAELLQQHSDYRVKLEGHTDYVGSVAYNEKLALARANTVKSFLEKYGAGAGQLTVSGMGKRAPEVPNTTKEGRFINRRVVMTVTDAQGNIIAAGGVSDVVPALDDRLKKLEDCCSQILQKLDKLDEILTALRDLKAEHDNMKAEIAALKAKPDPVIPQPMSEQTVARLADEALERYDANKPKKFSLVGVNLGPTDEGEFNLNGKARFFAPFREKSALQVEGEYMYYRGNANSLDPLARQEGQFDIGLVNRFGRMQAGTFASFKYLNLSNFQNGTTLGQAALTLDYIFSRGKIGFFGTKGFLDGGVVNRQNLGPTSFLEQYVKVVDQAGGSATAGLWGDAWATANFGAMFRRGGSNRPGGMIRLVQPLNDRVAFTVEGGLNETFIGNGNTGRVVFGLQFGNWLSPKDYGATDGPVPVDIPRVRYEILTRRSGNSAPVADAGSDQLVSAGQATLDGCASYDPDGDTLTFQWTQIAGPAVSLTGANTCRATFTAAEDQVYSFRLTVKDAEGLQSTARVTVTVRRNPSIRIARFQAQPNVIDAGQTTTLTWVVDNATRVEITGLGSVDPRSGQSTVSPNETTSYRLTARNDAGQEASETITVQVRRQEARILRFQATPATILPGEVSTLGWQTENATSVEISGIGTVAASGSTTVSPTQTTTYTLTARNQFGTVTSTATVQVTPGQVPRIVTFNAAPPEILPGEVSTLSWSVEGAETVSISTLGNVQSGGTASVSPTQDTTYTLTARNRFGEVTSTARVNVIAPAKILSFTATPSTQTEGQQVTLSWTTENATEVVITGIGTVPANGSRTVTPTQNTTYTLTAYGRRSQATAVAFVKINPLITNRAPVANAGPDQIIYRNNTALDGTQSFDPDRDPITYSWKLVNFVPDPATKGTGPSTPTISGANTARPVVTMPQWGQYVFELTVTDDKGESSTDYVRVTFVDP